MIKETNQTQHIFLSLIENKYYLDNKKLKKRLKELSIFDSIKIMNSDGEIEYRVGKVSTMENFYKSGGFEDDEEEDKDDEILFDSPLFSTENSIFEDLNYGDFTLVCPNPLYHFQIPERIRSLERFIQVNKDLGKKINFGKKIKDWVKDLKKEEGVDMENDGIGSLFTDLKMEKNLKKNIRSVREKVSVCIC